MIYRCTVIGTVINQSLSDMEKCLRQQQIHFQALTGTILIRMVQERIKIAFLKSIFLDILYIFKLL